MKKKKEIMNTTRVHKLTKFNKRKQQTGTTVLIPLDRKKNIYK